MVRPGTISLADREHLVSDSEKFSFEIRPDRDRVTVEVRGELDMATVPHLEEAIDALQRDGWRSIVLDLHDVVFMDARGLDLLLALERSARTDAWAFALRDGSPAVARLLEVTRLSERFPRA
jgi:anti-sigma B factor antagonist